MIREVGREDHDIDEVFFFWPISMKSDDGNFERDRENQKTKEKALL